LAQALRLKVLKAILAWYGIGTLLQPNTEVSKVDRFESRMAFGHFWCHLGENLRPTHTCIGCCSLTVGMDMIAGFIMLVSIFGLSTLTSKGDLEVLGHPVSPEMQCVVATWCFLGIVASVCAGVAVVHHLAMPLRMFWAYLVLCFPVYVVTPMVLLMSGSICDKMVSPDMQQEGEAFVCSFTDTFVFFWLLMCGAFNMYACYIVWSACEEIARSPFPQLIQYSDALKAIHMPAHPAKYEHRLSNSRAAAFGSGIKGMDPGMLMGAYGVVGNPADESYGQPDKQAPTQLSMRLAKDAKAAADAKAASDAADAAGQKNENTAESA